MSERYKTTRTARFTSTSIPYVERGDRDRILAEGTRREQVHLAMQRDLSPKHAERIARDFEADIAQFIIGTADARTLDVLVETHPQLLHHAGATYNASPALKMKLPLLEHPEVNLGLFLEEVGATESQARELFRRRRRGRPPGGPTLGEVWQQITS